MAIRATVFSLTMESNASMPKRLPLSTYPSNEGIDKNNTYATVPRIMDQNMILDILHYPPRSSITALRTFFERAILAGSCTLPLTSLIFVPELFDQGAAIRAKVDEQLTAATGILGAIAGYLFGKAAKGPETAQKSNTAGTT
jgi:hypothetical protein